MQKVKEKVKEEVNLVVQIIEIPIENLDLLVNQDQNELVLLLVRDLLEKIIRRGNMEEAFNQEALKKEENVFTTGNQELEEEKR